jgi:tRNA threonylcarbamoyladenosine biosynthesis protein TsaE
MSAAQLRVSTASEVETLALGERIGRGLQPGDLVSLRGPLGAGKTALVRGIAIGVGADPEVVRSPTFVLHHVYQRGRMTLHHIDAYRLGARADIAFLDIEGLLESGAVLVEWGDLVDLSRYAPLEVAIDADSRETRVIALLTRVAPSRITEAWTAPR